MNPNNRVSIYDESDTSFSDFICAKWDQICRCLRYPPDESAKVSEALREVLLPWGAELIGNKPTYMSGCSFDGFPVEMSINWSGGRTQLRTLFESLGSPPTRRSCQIAGSALTRRLMGAHDVSIDAYRPLEDLFLAQDSAPPTVELYQGIAWRPGSSPEFKAYITTPRPCPGAADLIGEAMSRLGMLSAWKFLAGRVATSNDSGSELLGVGVDLTRQSDYRIKVYYLHKEATFVELDRMARLAIDHDSDDALDAYQRVLGTTSGRAGNSPLTCFAFRQGFDAPVEVSTYLRLPGQTSSDGMACARISDLMLSRGIDPREYVALLRQISPAPLSDVTGLQELVSYKASGRGPDITVYLRFPMYY